MGQVTPGVGRAMRAPPPHSLPSPFPARFLAGAVALVVLADAPWAFTRGDVLRGVVLSFVAALAAVLGALAPGRTRGEARASWLLLLPLAVPLLALPATGTATLSSVLRDASVWLAAAALGLGLWRVWREVADVRAAWLALVAAGALAGAWTTLDLVARWAPGVGPFGRPGIAGPVLGALLAPALLLPAQRRVRLGTSLAIGLGCLATLSRTGLLAAAFGTLVALALGAAGAPTRRRARLGLVGAVCLAGLGLGLSAAGRLPVPGGGTTLAVRAGLWRATSGLVAERPLAGHGLGTFPAEILRVRDAEEAVLSAGRRPRVAHNDVLHVAAEGGIPAGLALATWLVAALGLGIAAARRTGPAGRRSAAAAAAGALLAVAVASLGEDVLLDPAGALLASVGAASLLWLAAPGRATIERLAVPVLLLLGLASLASAAVKTRDLLADAHLRAYRDAVRDGADPLTATQAAQDELVRGVLAWRADHAEGHYRLGVHRAEFARYPQARESWRAALAADPGMTEAWLDIARTYELEDRVDDARAALQEAVRRDPTRYDVRMRLGHLALGKEPVPGEPSGADFDPIRAHRLYNEADRAAPNRFETAVGRARIARRRGDLTEAAAQLRRAESIRPKAPETLLESFRLAEVERRVPDLGVAGILGLAIAAEPAFAARIQAEAEDLLAEGRAREATARQAVEGTLTPPDYAAADRAYDAAARRLAGLLHGRGVDPGVVLARARAEEEERAWRPALARLRAVLSWASTAPPEVGRTRTEWLRSLAEALERAARAASRTDGPLARHFYARAHAAQGALLLDEQEWAEARRVLERAATESPRDARVRVDLARALVRAGEADGAEQALLDALARDPDLRYEILVHPFFVELVGRPALAAALK